MAIKSSIAIRNLDLSMFQLNFRMRGSESEASKILYNNKLKNSEIMKKLGKVFSKFEKDDQNQTKINLKDLEVYADNAYSQKADLKVTSTVSDQVLIRKSYT